ncbi:class I SAM-dependent methyltransferase [Candidatus Venteria ishoeyi]|uniref:Bifunctional 3-demethylubiquinone-9 3-methyltransferase/ 2-octaprenyl-6-hydroxy phenol methylase n=1 Tax=Candidatus Venteria ishoeyi TaxID=1899563 RepID=A0A1H6F8F1_9GAMM|nr:class I SAM-dependent methyltransferase [Candidatus Venteria ishoeyi]SEH05589.1 bifunctional 3-demethylubiquinone-9 3-methyltransferase/ 2-octaprenyl-6-hydroxy phenol methylase [Candidatus Venteria ishoeyi]SEH07070.1 bifunctional 3-demethylubiquinone-9 3-methyltransferase/ 2-octaprenyl-6-hydroxy phenol methylase [Candidatus Venteria ishoeyi]
MKQKSALPSWQKNDLESCACPVCQSEQHISGHVFEFPPFQVVRCANCQLWYLSPRLKESVMLDVYADPSYFAGGGDSGYADKDGHYRDQETALRPTFRAFLGQMQKAGIEGGSLLEIGTSYGFFLQEAASFFDTLSGTDFDAEAVKQVQALGFQGLRGGLEAIPEGEQYNCISSMSVIEHVYDPVAFVKTLSGHLTPEGWMVFATPKINGFWFKLMGKRWSSFKIPEHITYYDVDTLSYLFHQAGAKQLKVLPYPAAYPLGLIAAKLGMKIPNRLAGLNFWLPGTMFAIAAQF